MKLFPNAWIILICLSAWLATSVQGAIEFRAVTDFSITKGNPNGVWSYGWRPAGTSEFNLMENTSHNRWFHGDASGPFISTDHYFITIGTQNGEVPVLRWTAPYDMSLVKMYEVFWPISHKIQLNGQDLEQVPGCILDYNYDTCYQTLNNGVHQGDTIDFSFQQSAGYIYVDVYVLPEPATYLAGLGLLGLFALIESKSIRLISR